MKKENRSWAWGLMPVFPALKRLLQEADPKLAWAM